MQHSNTAGCILLKFYIKPQHTANVYNLLYVVSYRNSTSNHNFFSQCYGNLEVVSYRNSTSNHNEGYDEMKELYVVSYRNSTSNHNIFLLRVVLATLYLIEILHQTTTSSCVSLFILCCILSKFYIKPQLRVRTLRRNRSCILSKFYIKPQQRLQDANIENVVSYRNSTSNHNHHDTVEYQFKVVSYRNSTSNHNCDPRRCFRFFVVSYRNSTSNHNKSR